jgi:hypothetical protein
MWFYMKYIVKNQWPNTFGTSLCIIKNKFVIFPCRVVHSEYIFQLRNHARNGACRSHWSTTGLILYGWPNKNFELNIIDMRRHGLWRGRKSSADRITCFLPLYYNPLTKRRFFFSSTICSTMLVELGEISLTWNEHF